MGVEIVRITQGDGINFPKPRDKVVMHYVGTLSDGSEFDSSFNRGTPFKTTIGVGKVIKGWDEAVPKMSLGECSKLTITGDFAYGERGFPNLIPPNATLVL
ncbi:FK506-binding protein 1 [Choiromyces venosus 120613-1]|uniref:peptidylprolyl isomerase n=1 Tax=Choiromyces venosus 120613-1 TaxID=1336337 RepID=A0A3N4K3D9_9PEZI|nr:FK506-binding protein 1 [Choiromyces venosus 120613-1]